MNALEAPHDRRILVVSGTSGAGKTSVAKRLLRDPRFGRARTATTRPPRDGERDGVDYDFLSEAAFAEALAKGAFLEHAVVYGRHYGTPRANLESVLAAGRHCVLVVDVQGARNLKAMGLEALYVFIEAPGMDELRRRLERRGQDAPDVIEERLEAAAKERDEARHFDVVLVNDDIEETTRRLAAEAGLQFEPGPADAAVGE